jgi:hypothetical protein
LVQAAMQLSARIPASVINYFLGFSKTLKQLAVLPAAVWAP